MFAGKAAPSTPAQSITTGPRCSFALDEVDADVVAECIGRLLDSHPGPAQLGDTVRHSLLRALGRIAFPAATFTVGARLMLRLLGVEGGTDSEHLPRPFTALFPAIAGATEADGNHRLRFLDNAVVTSDATRVRHVVGALAAGCDPVGRLDRGRPGSARLPANSESLASGHDDRAGSICWRMHLSPRRTRFKE